MIIIEGPDNSGKTTLGRYIASALALPFVEGEGPPKAPGEINERILRYRNLPLSVMVRHPCVSEPIYGQFRKPATDIDPKLCAQFYQEHHLLIYCDPLKRGLIGHVLREGVDHADHLKIMDDNWTEIVDCYRLWAIHAARLMYRIGDDMGMIARLCMTITSGI